MKKGLMFGVLFLSMALLAGCGPSEPSNDSPVKTISIYNINDFHGAVEAESSKPGLSKIGRYLKDERAIYPDGTVIVSAGDMFQGSAISNLTKGELVVDGMNEIGFDSMTIGNHEFDWQVSNIERFQDGDMENGEADFPFLACNIYANQGTDDLSDDVVVDWADPYTVVTLGEVKIGIVGYIGVGIEEDIAYPIISPYTFREPSALVGQYASELRNELSCDLVIAVGHDANDSTNQLLANLTGDSAVNLIVNGHSHYQYIKEINDITIIQSGSSGSYIGKTVLTYDVSTKSLLTINSTQINTTTLSATDPELDALIDEVYQEYDSVINRVLGTSETTVSRGATVTQWVSDCSRKYVGAELGFQNDGGVRAAAFPIRENESITVKKMYEMMPFDNTIKLCTLKGSVIKQIIEGHSDYRINTGVDYLTLEDDQDYRVAACDYIFDADGSLFLREGREITQSHLLVRDAMIADIEAWTGIGSEWNPINGSMLTAVSY